MKTIKSFGPLLLVLLCLATVAGACKANGYSAISTRTTSSAHHHIPRGGAAISAAPIPTTPIQSFVATIKDSRRHLAAAAVARCVSIFGMYPMDTIKVSSIYLTISSSSQKATNEFSDLLLFIILQTRIQMGMASPFRLKGVYGGVAGSLIGQVPYGVLTFGSYEMYKKGLQEKFPEVKPVFTYALAAILGDLTGSGWLCPSEVIKQQMQAGMFSSTREAFTTIWKTKGLGGLYQGYWGGVARDVPFRVAQLTTYEVTKSVYLKYKAGRVDKKNDVVPESLDLTAIESAMCGAIAGSFSAAITCPLDRIKTLLMTDSSYGGTVAACASKIFQEEGLGGFVTGLVPRVVYIAPSVAVFFIAYEQVQQRLQHWETPASTV